MKSSPIYCKVNNPSRRSSCDFGAAEYFELDVLVGTSARNSHELGVISVSRHLQDDGTVKFQIWLDGMLLKAGILDGQDFELIHNDLAKISAFDELKRRENGDW